jgi:aspartate 1-decarboxylase
MRIMLKSKIHRAHVTDANIDYEGSITIDKRLMAEADILPYEQVQVLNINNGVRFDTYAIEGREDSGEICMNGAAARLAVKGDTIIILSYCHVSDEEARNIKPKLVYVDANNAVVKVVDEAIFA